MVEVTLKPNNYFSFYKLKTNIYFIILLFYGHLSFKKYILSKALELNKNQLTGTISINSQFVITNNGVFFVFNIIVDLTYIELVFNKSNWLVRNWGVLYIL